ncbi:MAG: transposase [Planctomycetaceae bacterium]|nr:transposase [Planctomycetaceae bacterium]
MGCFKQSTRRVALFVEQVLNQPCSHAWVVKLQNQATAALRPAYDKLIAKLPDEAVLGIDESPTKEARMKSWLWAFVAKNFTAFAHRTTRVATVLRDMLTDAPRRGELQSGEDVLERGSPAMVLGSFEAGPRKRDTVGADRPPRPHGETSGPRPDAAE